MMLSLRRVLSASMPTVACLLGAAPLMAQQPVVPASYTVGAVQAKLFYSKGGTFSDDMLVVPRLSLWNTIIGEGWAKAPSSATIVLVEVTGAPNSSAQRAVELTATEDTPRHKVALRRRVDLVSMESDGKQYVAFWLYDTGCTPLALRVRLVGQSDSTVTQKHIPFLCGE